ncbi:MAG: hypothetical protein CBD69_005635, partial [Crocinitomicaceae bacterium TMED209]
MPSDREAHSQGTPALGAPRHDVHRGQEQAVSNSLSTPRTLLGWVLAVVVPVLVADQCLKVWVKLNFSLGERIAFIPGLLELQFIENEGMAFGWALPGMAGQLGLGGFLPLGGPGGVVF